MSEITPISPELDRRLKNIESMLNQVLSQNSEWIDVDEASRISGLSPRTIYNYQDKGKLKIQHQYRGRKLEFNRAAFLDWNASRVFRVRS